MLNYSWYLKSSIASQRKCQMGTLQLRLVSNVFFKIPEISSHQMVLRMITSYSPHICIIISTAVCHNKDQYVLIDHYISVKVVTDSPCAVQWLQILKSITIRFYCIFPASTVYWLVANAETCTPNLYFRWPGCKLRCFYPNVANYSKSF